MSAFSEMLQCEVDSNNLSAMRISACTNISRPTVAKILNGQRIPTMEELVSIMALMPLPESKRADLMEELDNLRFGNGVCSSLKSVFTKTQFLPVAHKVKEMGDDAITPEYPEDGVLMLNSRSEVLFYALNALNDEMKNHSCPTVYTNTTRNYRILQENMIGLLSDVGDKVDFKICTQIIKGKQKGSIENFEQLFDWTPFFLNNCDVLFEYASEITDVVPFGFTDYLIMSDAVIFANERLDKAMFITERNTVDEIKNMCQNRMYSMKNLVRRCSDIFEFFNFLKNSSTNLPYTNYMQYAPCVIPYMDYEDMQVVAKTEIPEVAAVLHDVYEYYKTFDKYIKKAAFSKKGLIDFINDGKLFEIPAVYVNPVPVDMRYKLLEKMFKKMESDDTDIRIVNDNFVNYPKNACVEYVKDTQLVFTWYDKKRDGFSGKVSVITAEATLLEEASNFFDTLFESRYLYTKKQSMDILKKCINDMA